jgi:hypothetical protein
MSKLFTVKKIDINSDELIKRLTSLIKKYKRNNICLYVNWLAVDLGLPKVTLTSFLLDNKDTFLLNVGSKSKQLILKGIVEKNRSSLREEYEQENEGEKNE